MVWMGLVNFETSSMACTNILSGLEMNNRAIAQSLRHKAFFVQQYKEYRKRRDLSLRRKAFRVRR
jgi:hypothetical protein